MVSAFIVLGLILALLAFSVARSARRSREAAERRRQEEERLREQGGDGFGSSPFSTMPFGSIFDQIFSGTGMRSRSLAYDPETGQWVDITDEYPEGEEPAAEGAEGADAGRRGVDEDGSRRQAHPQPTRQAGMGGGLGGLFGSLGGGLGGVLFYSVLFGLGHYEQGYDATIATGLLGAFWGVVYLVRRSIIAPVVSHAGFNLAQVLKFLVLR